MKHLKLSPYPVFLHVRFSEKNLKETDVAATFDTERGHVLVVFRPKSLQEDYLSTVVHESVHVVQAVSNYITTPLDMESQAYLTEWVFSWLRQNCEKYLVK